MYAEAIDAYFAASRLQFDRSRWIRRWPHLLRQAYDVGGVQAFWRVRIDMLKKPAQTGGYTLAKYHARLGENEQVDGSKKHAKPATSSPFSYSPTPFSKI